MTPNTNEKEGDRERAVESAANSAIGYLGYFVGGGVLFLLVLRVLCVKHMLHGENLFYGT